MGILELDIADKSAGYIYKTFCQLSPGIFSYFQDEYISRNEESYKKEHQLIDRSDIPFTETRRTIFSGRELNIEVIYEMAWWNESELSNTSARLFVMEENKVLVSANAFSEESIDLIKKIRFYSPQAEEKALKLKEFLKDKFLV